MMAGYKTTQDLRPVEPYGFGIFPLGMYCDGEKPSTLALLRLAQDDKGLIFIDAGSRSAGRVRQGSLDCWLLQNDRASRGQDPGPRRTQHRRPPIGLPPPAGNPPKPCGKRAEVRARIEVVS